MNGRRAIATLRAALLAAVLAALALAVPVAPVAPVAAAPAAQSVDVDVILGRVQIFPLGTARVQMTLVNPTSREQVIVLEILLKRADGTIAVVHLTDPLSLSPGITIPAIYAVPHADGAVEAVVTPRRWPTLGS